MPRLYMVNGIEVCVQGIIKIGGNILSRKRPRRFALVEIANLKIQNSPHSG
jgi:hypothetical protein